MVVLNFLKVLSDIHILLKGMNTFPFLVSTFSVRCGWNTVQYIGCLAFLSLMKISKTRPYFFCQDK